MKKKIMFISVLVVTLLLPLVYILKPKEKQEPKLIGLPSGKWSPITDTSKINELEEAYKYAISVDPPTEADIKKYGIAKAWKIVEAKGTKERDSIFKSRGEIIPDKYK